MIKCIATDMDGTLLNMHEKVSEANKRAIEHAQSKGVEVVVATGRSYLEARHALDEAGLKCPVISINGAVVWDEEGEMVASNPMDREDVERARAVLDEADIYYEVYTNKGTYTYDKKVSIETIVDLLVSAFPDVDPAYLEKRATERFDLGLVHVVPSYAELFADENIQCFKMLVFSGDQDLLGHTGGKLKEHTSLTVSSSGKENLEITSPSAQKGIALEKFVAKRNIALSDTMAIGDSYNDISMFEKAGKAVAMGNAIADIQRFCDEVTLSNHEDGVAHAIEKALK
ncbi:Cof-type HAD-IIB family hydrolase [Bacillus massiliigorillae]|uniref:Cof-type HAD-IIB family hydrolase n=1 Tax=Bacillus massiliigorillae TaxID=1243664 RepID=UPI00039E34A7|nr:Cof-type HAD-IIB family hydrolase [Bacillus massiliigorillae]